MLFRHLKHREIIPVVAITGLGFVASMGYLARLALKNVDCSWDRKNNPNPWTQVPYNQNVKLLSYQPKANFKDDRPKF